MILTGMRIKQAVYAGEIHITPLNEAHIGPNSIDVTLAPVLRCYDDHCLDAKTNHTTWELPIPPEGLVLQPGKLYLGSTVETAVSKKYVPMYEGRSSIARLGVATHITAGFGDIGWGYERIEGRMGPELVCTYPTWTLEITVVQPVRLYAGMRVGQVYFLEASGGVDMYHGKYTKQKGPQPSMAYKDFE